MIKHLDCSILIGKEHGFLQLKYVNGDVVKTFSKEHGVLHDFCVALPSMHTAMAPECDV